MKHTPGPWTYEIRRDRSVAKELGAWWRGLIRVGEKNPGNTLATVSLGGPGAIRKEQKFVEANARLIAAAPDLLIRLKQFVETVEDCPDLLPSLRGHVQVAKRAIAKAEGTDGD